MKTLTTSAFAKRVTTELNKRDNTQEYPSPWACWIGSDSKPYASFQRSHVTGGETDRQALNNCYKQVHPDHPDICGELEEEWRMEAAEKEEKKVVTLKLKEKKEPKEKKEKVVKEKKVREDKGLQWETRLGILRRYREEAKVAVPHVLDAIEKLGFKSTDQSVSALRSGTLQTLRAIRHLKQTEPEVFDSLWGDNNSDVAAE